MKTAYWFRATFITKAAHVLLLVLPAMTASQRQKWNLLRHIFSGGQTEVSKHRFKLLHLHFTALFETLTVYLWAGKRTEGRLGKSILGHGFRLTADSHVRLSHMCTRHLFWHHSFVEWLSRGRFCLLPRDRFPFPSHCWCDTHSMMNLADFNTEKSNYFISRMSFEQFGYHGRHQYTKLSRIYFKCKILNNW